MGFLDRQKEKNDRWIRDAYEGRTEPGEQVVTSFRAITRIPWWPWLLLFPVFFYFEFELGISAPPWVTGAAAGAIIAIFLRNHFVVLTDRRVLVLDLAWMSQKRVARETVAPRSDASAEFGGKFLNVRLKLRTGSARHDLVVARSYMAEANRLVTELSGSPAPPGG
jgi:hypothetical protein